MPLLTAHLAVAAFVLAFIAPAAQAAEEETHFFDATLSLTGDCSESTIDPVPDPGCPGGEHPPAGPFVWPTAVATDPFGNIFVANIAKPKNETARIDVFSPSGHYLTGIPTPFNNTVAVDSAGHVYACQGLQGALIRFDPTVYKPEQGEIVYGSPEVVVAQPSACEIAVGANDHLYVYGKPQIKEYGPASEGNPLLTEEIGEGLMNANSGRIAVDLAHGRIYVTRVAEPILQRESKVLVLEAEPPYAVLQTIDGPSPGKNFVTAGGSLPLAVSKASGHFFVYDVSVRKVYEFDLAGNPVSTITRNFQGESQAIAIDNGEKSPNQDYLFVPSGEGPPAHLFAFEPKTKPVPPVVESLSFDSVTEDEAILRAQINPKSVNTHYVFEYVSQENFENEGFAGAMVAGEGDIAAGGEGVEVFAAATGLEPGTDYRFRVRVENQCEAGGCSSEEEGRFTTFGPYPQSASCENHALRVGASIALPDCRAFELVTPTSTNGRFPFGPAHGWSGDRWGAPPASAAGDSVAFTITGGPIPGLDGGAGGFNGDLYTSARTSTGWQTVSAGPSGAETSYPIPGGVSSDHGFSAVTATILGTLPLEGKPTSYIRYPDGSFRLTGEGSLGVDRKALPWYIAANGTHIIFESSAQLEPNAAPEGLQTIYDRTPDGVTHVVSLLPGDAPASGPAEYLGSSSDGSTVAFIVGGESSPLYLRINNLETVVAAPAGSDFAGLSNDGRYLFYVSEGDLYRYDTHDDEGPSTEEGLKITATGDVTVVNIAAEGTAAYFLSPSLLGEEPNSLGAEPQAGAHNLYYWNGSVVRFVGTVTERDVVGEEVSDDFIGGLGLWLDAVGYGATARVPARSTPDGTALLFESRADLAGYESGGKAQIYRYDGTEGSLLCLSCAPTQAAPTSDASLITLLGSGALNPFSLVPNLAPDADRAFFESAERLVQADNDGLRDVYEWEAEGKGSCATPGGCLFLISSGQSPRPDYLFGVSASGDDVFVASSDLLTASDVDETYSVYDARVNGGFAPPDSPSAECLGEACQPAVVAPNDPTPASSVFQGAGNVRKEARPRCPKGKRRVLRKGKGAKCVSTRKGSHRKDKTNTRRRAAR